MNMEAGIIKRLDEDVVNRIAAGEVIQRPCNALKEMMENSLDAGADSVAVTVDRGGLKTLQIRDNGSGIRRADLPIVCERFTTSKLCKFEDLESMETYGFRGEALASISYVAKVQIVTKTADEVCGYQAEYSGGQLLGEPSPCAANQGTQITVEDLFHNAPARKRALRSAADEFHRVADVVARYAIHNSGRAFSLKKAGEASLSVRTSKDSTLRDNVAAVFGAALARELVEVQAEDQALAVSIKGLVSNVNYSTKKFNFLLFINNRLVESTALKKALDLVYSAYLPKGSHPFVYLSLRIHPRNVDVNVHPTKHEVHFLNQEEIVQRVQQCVDEKLMASNKSRTFYTQTVLPGMPVKSADEASSAAQKRKSEDDSETKAKYSKEMVRTDAREQKLDRFFSPVSKANLEADSTVQGSSTECEATTEGNEESASNDKSKKPDPPLTSLVVPEDEQDPKQRVTYPDVDATNGKEPEVSTSSTSEGPVAPASDTTEEPEPGVDAQGWRDIKLDSVKNLRETVKKMEHPELRDLMANHSFVGCVDRSLALVQHSTSLYLVNVPRVSRELFYQLFLRDFGNLGVLRLNPPAPVKELVLMALESKEARWTEADGDKETVADRVCQCLVSRAEMLDDYFSMELTGLNCDDDDGVAAVKTLPMLAGREDFVPCFSALPVFLLRLASEVNWGDEEACFHTFTKELARFYAIKPDESSRYDPKQHAEASKEDGSDLWKRQVEEVVFGLGRKWLRPPRGMASDMTFAKVADLPDLYKVFERC